MENTENSIASQGQKYPAPISYVTIQVTSQDKNAAGFYDSLNQEQYNALQKFKQQLTEQKVIESFEVYDDLYLLRFLRARKFDLDKTMLMFKKFIQWRADKKVDEIRENFELSELFDVKKLYPHGYHKVDKLGRPVYIELICKINIDKLFKVTTSERMVDYYIKQYERQMKLIFPACSALAKKPIEQSCTILDVNGIGVFSLVGKTKDFIKLASDIGQDYYPEMLGKMSLINVGWLFRAVWSMIKGFIDPKTASKIDLHKNEAHKELLALIDADNLPKTLGGNCECKDFEFGCLGSDIGPWNTEGGITVAGKSTRIKAAP